MSGYADLSILEQPTPENIEDDKKQRSDAVLSALGGAPLSFHLTNPFSLKSFARDDFLSILFYFGFLSYDNKDFAIPNAAAKEAFGSYYARLILHDTPGINSTSHKKAMDQIAFTGDNSLFVKCVSEILMKNSTRVYMYSAERVIQIIGYAIAMNYTGFVTLLEMSLNGNGFVDLAFLPSKFTNIKYYGIVELKYITVDTLKKKAKANKMEDGSEALLLDDSESEGSNNGANELKKDAKNDFIKNTDKYLPKEEGRILKIKSVWLEALNEIKKYSFDPQIAELDKKGSLKKWIIIFSTYRCLVNQEIKNVENAEMELAEFEWWF
jgi:hypothetical protein